MLLNPSLIKKVLVTSLIYREVRILKLSKSEMKVNEAKLEILLRLLSGPLIHCVHMEALDIFNSCQPYQPQFRNIIDGIP